MLESLRLAVGVLSAVPVNAPAVDRPTAGRAMLWAPAVGAGMAAAAGFLAWVLDLLGTGDALAAVLAVAGMAALTRGLHLDGLADTADGLGSGRPAAEALAVMKASDIGPFGVVTVVLALAVQVAALTETWADGYGVAALVTASATGRLAVTWACHRLAPARPVGLGAMVARTVPTGPLALVSVAALVGGALLGWTRGGAGIVLGGCAVAGGTLAGLALAGHATRRLGGITGDVLGALVETGTAAALVVLALD